MAVIGVRISWLILARNSDLTRAASSAALRASVNSSARWASSVACCSARRRGNDRFVERFADNLCAGVPEGLLGGRVELGDPSVAIHREDTVEGGFENRTLSRFAFPQRLFGFPALGDIPHYADKRLGFSLGVGY